MREGILDKIQQGNPITIGFPPKAHRYTATWKWNELVNVGTL